MEFGNMLLFTEGEHVFFFRRPRQRAEQGPAAPPANTLPGPSCRPSRPREEQHGEAQLARVTRDRPGGGEARAGAVLARAGVEGKGAATIKRKEKKKAEDQKVAEKAA